MVQLSASRPNGLRVGHQVAPGAVPVPYAIVNRPCADSFNHQARREIWCRTGSAHLSEYGKPRTENHAILDRTARTTRSAASGQSPGTRLEATPSQRRLTAHALDASSPPVFFMPSSKSRNV